MTADGIKVAQVSDLTIGRRRLRWFLPVVNGCLLAGVFVGFAKTFFLRSQFTSRSMPGYLYVHGAVLTTWFALVLAQTYLVAVNRTALHRRLGMAAAAVAGLVIPLSAFVVVRAAQRELGPITPLLQLEIVGDLLSLIWFAGYVGVALWYRRRPDVHKRLMIASCFTIYGPVFARFELVYGLPIAPPAVLPLGLVALVAYDLAAARHLHRATVWIGVSWIGGLLLVLGGLMASGAAATIIQALRTL